MLKAGFSRTDVTPEMGIRLGGYGIEHRPAEKILDPLHATVIALEQGHTKTLIINLDWLAIEEETVCVLRGKISKTTAVEPQNITVSTIHTHNAPNTLNLWGWGDAEQKYVEDVTPAIIDCCRQAVENLTPVSVGFNEGETKTGINRRWLNTDNTPCLSPGDEHGSYDPFMTVADFRNEANECIGIIVHCSAHCTALNGIENINSVSRDWVGIMKDRIESLYDAPVLFLNGAIGDAAPRSNDMLTNKLSSERFGLHQMREVGYRAATDAVNALIRIKEWRSDVELKVFSEEISLPYAPLTPLAQAQKEIRQWENKKDQWGAGMCNYKHLSAVISEHQQPPCKGNRYLQTITSIGPLAVIPFPGEIFSQISLRIRRFSPYRYSLCCSLCNGFWGYVVTQEQRIRGGYEVWAAKARSPYMLTANIDDILVETTIGQLRKLIS